MSEIEKAREFAKDFVNKQISDTDKFATKDMTDFFAERNKNK